MDPRARRLGVWLFFFSLPGLFVATARSQDLIRQKVATGHVPIEALRPALEKVLSPEGRFVILPGQGQILVIDRAENIAAAEKAIALIEAPAPQVALDFAIKTNVAAGMAGPQPVDSIGDFPFPTRYQPPRIIGGIGNGFVVVPAHPTGFKRRAVGDTLETTGIVNADGSISLDINAEQTEFEGFINYGSAILSSGVPGSIPVVNGVANPRFFQPILQQNQILVPIFETTRINTQILIKPEVVQNQVTLDLIPQLEIESAEPGAEKTAVPLTQFRTTLGIQNGQTGKINGFTGASAAFNRHFLGAKEEDEGGTAIQIRASLRPGEVKQ
ncbi:MAG: hypothetical protein KDM63_15715 [Verrucomicrobiae bacterium]|nr:hypothetical protein [Verrucomicrobiae bacterium]